MKRIFALFMVCMILVGGVASAKVLKGKDSFSGEFYILSWQYPKPFLNTMSFGKKMYDNNISYELSISNIQMKTFVLDNLPIKFKIDGYPVYELTDYRYKLTGPDSYGVEYNSMIDVKFPNDIADKIRDAKKIAIQFEYVDGTRVPYTLPDEVLAEWQQVINATEYDILDSLNKKK